MNGPRAEWVRWVEMSDESVEVVREIHRRWASGESTAELISEELEYVNPPYAVESGTRVGRRRALGKIRASRLLRIFRFEPEHFVDAGADVVVVAPATRRLGRAALQATLRRARSCRR